MRHFSQKLELLFVVVVCVGFFSPPLSLIGQTKWWKKFPLDGFSLCSFRADVACCLLSLPPLPPPPSPHHPSAVPLTFAPALLSIRPIGWQRADARQASCEPGGWPPLITRPQADLVHTDTQHRSEESHRRRTFNPVMTRESGVEISVIY